MLPVRWREPFAAAALAVLIAACSTTEPARPAVTSTLTPPVSSVPPNEGIELAFTFRDADGNLIASAPVSLSTPLPGATFTPASGTISADGVFTTVFEATTPGAAPVTATVGGRTAVVLPQFSVCTPVELDVPETVAGSLGAGQCFSASRSNALYRFTLSTSSVVSLSVAAVFAASLAITPLPPDDHIVVDAAQGEAVDWVLPVGAYEARVGAASGVGAFSLSSQAVGGTAGCVQRYIATGVTILGQNLGAGDCDFGDGTKFDSYGIYSSRPCSIRLQSIDFTPFLWLYDTETFLINGTTGEAPGNDAVFGLPACKYINAPIFIWVNTDEGEVGGNYTLVVTFPAVPPSLAPDTVRLVRAAHAVPAMSRSTIRELRARARATGLAARNR